MMIQRSQSPQTQSISRPPVARRQRARLAAIGLGVALALCCAPDAHAQFGDAKAADSKPYDDKLVRLAEILGAVHYLRELCGAADGQMWRDRMREIMDGEGANALRRALLTKSFNSGYRSYSRTYQSCSPTAQTAINRFLTEGVQLADGLVKSVP